MTHLVQKNRRGNGGVTVHQGVGIEWSLQTVIPGNRSTSISIPGFQNYFKLCKTPDRQRESTEITNQPQTGICIPSTAFNTGADGVYFAGAEVRNNACSIRVHRFAKIPLSAPPATLPQSWSNSWTTAQDEMNSSRTTISLLISKAARNL